MLVIEVEGLRGGQGLMNYEQCLDGVVKENDGGGYEYGEVDEFV